MTGVSPNPHADGHDGFGLCDELVPGVAAGVEDGVVVIEDAVREPVLAEVLPDVLDRVQFGRSGRQEEDGEVLGTGSSSGLDPSYTVGGNY